MKGQFMLGLPIVELDVENERFKFLLDTGFNGAIMLPAHIIEALGLKQVAVTNYVTANGDTQITRVYRAMVNLFGEEKKVLVLSTSASFSLAGLQLFHLCKIILERHKDVLEIEKTG